MIVGCPDCGRDFPVSPSNHLAGKGCPWCASIGFQIDQPGILYWLRVDSPWGTFWKLGITNKTVEERYVGDLKSGVTITVLWEYPADVGKRVYDAERELLKLYAWALVPKGTASPFSHTGINELFAENIFGDWRSES